MTGAVAGACMGLSTLEVMSLPATASASNPDTNGANFTVHATPILDAGIFGYRLEGLPDGTYENWLVAGAASNYEAKATVTSGALSSGTTGSWVRLNTDFVLAVTNASGAATITLEIGRYGTSTALDSCTVTLTP